MDIQFDSAAFGLGCAGAFAHESLRWISLRTEDKMPAYWAKIHYWLLTALLVIVGGGLASVLSPISVVQALCFGIAAPAILSRIGTLAPAPESLGPGDAAMKSKPSTVTSLQEFLRG